MAKAPPIRSPTNGVTSNDWISTYCARAGVTDTQIAASIHQATVPREDIGNRRLPNPTNRHGLGPRVGDGDHVTGFQPFQELAILNDAKHTAVVGAVVGNRPH